MNELPLYVYLLFIITTIITILLFRLTLLKANRVEAKKTANRAGWICIVWLMLQALLSMLGVYSNTGKSGPPPIFLFGVLPNLIFIVTILFSAAGKKWMDALPLLWLTLIHSIRIPVELCLHVLSEHKAIPQIMTYEGWNWDILSGLSAPLIAYYGVVKNGGNKKILLFWNIICLLLLLNIVTIAFLSTPSPLQKLAFDQPNIAVLHFPFSWLPSFIVPVVLFSHIAAIRQLIKVRRNTL